jgi:bifunctional UDP-N-acetylglucosamine pyrophosphorylase/glucosamine-1-phosphate N-acetyltransferase
LYQRFNAFRRTGGVSATFSVIPDEMTLRPCLNIILAAGQGTRMKSQLPKVLHPIAGLPMLAHAMNAAAASGPGSLAVVVAAGAETTMEAARAVYPEAKFFVQEPPLGTAHAVLAAREALEGFSGDVTVLYGDTPLMTAGTLARLRVALAEGADAVVLGFDAASPAGYGRLIRDEAGRLIAIREEKDATDEERAITFCNSGVMGFRAGVLLPLLSRIGNGNAKGEYYLTDAIELAAGDGAKVCAIECSETEVLGVNDRIQLAAAEALMQQRLRTAAMAEGVTMLSPETVTLSWDTWFGRDVTIEPNVFFGPGVAVEDNVRIKAFCHFERARIREGAVVGPFARLRPDADVGPGAHIGNFVEIKNAVVEAGAKANHLAYVGDARVGAGANIGAGAITCNYDGFAKHKTDIGTGAFVGSNCSLVAPVRIGDGAYVGSGSVVTKDVASDALAIERSSQKELPGWAARVRARHGK